MASIAQVRTQLLPHALAPDPDRANLRLAARAAVTYSLVFAVAWLVLGSADATLFAAFAVFGLLVLANFGGPIRNRLAAFLLTTLVGATLVVVGSLASPSFWTATLVTLVVVFGIEFAGVFGGYVAGARAPLLMAVVLAASVPAPVSAIPERIIGWLLGGCVSAAAAVLLWPLHERDVLRKTASAALRSLATLMGTTRVDPGWTEPARVAAQAVALLRTVYRQTAYRPGGPTRRDRALAQLVTQLERAQSFAVALGDERRASNPGLAEGDRLASTVVSVFEASADVLEDGRVPDLHALEQARRAHRTALDTWASAQLRSGASSASVLEGIDYDQRLRALAYLGLAIGANAAIVAGRDVEVRGMRIPYETPIELGLAPTLRRVWRTLLTHLSWTSPVLHNGVRAALGLALAVLVARLFGLAHGYWVVLGTMSVVRSNALATGRTAVQAVTGTVVGFAIGGLFAVLFGQDPAVLWAALPVAVFLAAYTPSALSFLAGQAAFTVLMLVLFNVLSPVGWSVGLVRIEDLVVGSAIGVVVGTLLWPRGARSDFAHALARLYRLTAVHLSEAFDLALGHGRLEAVDATRAQVQQARETTAESFDQLLREHSSTQFAPEVAGFMVAAADQAVIVAESLRVLVDTGYVAGDGWDGTDRVDSHTAALVASWFMLAERIEGVSAVRTVPLHGEELRQAALTALESWRGESSQRGKAAIGVAWVRVWLEQLGILVRDLEDRAARVAANAAAPWWK